jgi:hypothetical protein
MPVGMTDDGCFKMGMSVVGDPVKNVFDPDDARARFLSVNTKVA